MRWSMGAALVVMAAGCTPPPELEPLSVDDQQISAFLFERFDAADATEFERGIVEVLLPLMRGRIAAVGDPGDPMDDGWLADLPVLTEDQLGTLSMPEGVTSEEQKFPLARVRQSGFTVADNRALATEPNRICLESETTRWATRDFTSDATCFADGSCDELTVLQPTYKQNPLARIWYDQLFDIRVIDLQLDKKTTVEALVTRGWTEEVWYSRDGSNSWDQIWSLDILIDDGEGGSIGWNAYWTSLQVLGLTDGLLESSIREGLHQTAYWTEHFMDTGEAHPDCTEGPVNNDRSDEMPTRWKNEG